MVDEQRRTILTIWVRTTEILRFILLQQVLSPRHPTCWGWMVAG